MTKTVLITSISGFIAKRIAFDLLEQGYKVIGSVRSSSRQGEVRAALTGTKLDNISFVSLDLNSDDGWDTAMAGVDVVMHTASPFPMANPKDENDVIQPAVQGTVRAMAAAERAGVKRVVLTSSMVAIMHSDRPAGHNYGPGDWTDINHPTANAYVKSKTLVERAAWDFVQDHPEMQLTTINPGLVLGQPMDKHYGTSLRLVERLMAAKDPMQPNIGFPVVDVADVSALHVKAMQNDATIGQRIVASDRYWTMPEMAAALAEAYPNRGINTKIAPKFLLKLLSLFDRDLRSVIPLLGWNIQIDNISGHDLLGEFIPAQDALIASAKFVAK